MAKSWAGINGGLSIKALGQAFSVSNFKYTSVACAVITVSVRHRSLICGVVGLASLLTVKSAVLHYYFLSTNLNTGQFLESLLAGCLSVGFILLILVSTNKSIMDY